LYKTSCEWKNNFFEQDNIEQENPESKKSYTNTCYISAQESQYYEDDCYGYAKDYTLFVVEKLNSILFCYQVSQQSTQKIDKKEKIECGEELFPQVTLHHVNKVKILPFGES
jgi:hypothetical protein